MNCLALGSVSGAWQGPLTEAGGWAVGAKWAPQKKCGSHIDAPHSRQPLVKGEILVRHEVNAVMVSHATRCSNAWPMHAQYADDRSPKQQSPVEACCTVGSSSQADCLLRNSAMDDSIGGS